MDFGEIRSAVHAALEDDERLDLAVFALLCAREDADLWRMARPYARAALARIPCGRTSAWEIAEWCIEGLPALERHLSRFSPVTGRGLERWAAVFAWATVVSQRHGLGFSSVQATSSYRTEDGITHQLIMMTDHREQTYLLDVQQGPGDLCLGIVSGRVGGERVNVKWSGELPG